MPKSDSYDSFFFDYVFIEERLSGRMLFLPLATIMVSAQLCYSPGLLLCYYTLFPSYQALQPMTQAFEGNRGRLLARCQRFVDTVAVFGFAEPIFIERAC